MRSLESTFVGYAVAPDLGEAPREEEDRTVVDRLDQALESGERLLYQDSEEHALLTRDMVEELRAKLRAAEEAEARDASGVFLRTPANGLAPVAEPRVTEPRVTEPRVTEPRVTEPAPTEEPDLDDLLSGLEAIAPMIAQEAEAPVAEAPFAEEGGLDAVIASVPQVEASLAANSESNFYAGFDDEHPDGVFVATYEILPEGTPVYVDVHLPAGYAFRTPAIVEWVRRAETADDPELPSGMGLRMCGLDAPMRRLIRTYARHRKPIFWIG